MKRSDLAEKFNPHHIPAGNGRESGRFTTGDGAGDGGNLVHPIIKKPIVPKKPPPEKKPGDDKKPDDAKKPPDKGDPSTDHGSTPSGHRFAEHGRKEATERGFTEKNVDDIVANNKKRSNGVDLDGRKTWRHSDPRGNTVILNDEGGVVTVYSPASRGVYIPKP